MSSKKKNALPASTASAPASEAKNVVTEQALTPVTERSQTQLQTYTCESLSPELRKAMIVDLHSGMGVNAIAKKHSVTDHLVTELRRQDDEEHTVDLSRWKRHTAATLSQFVAKGGTRLVNEVDKIPIASLPVAVAIAVDKINALHDQPQVVTEHRLRVTHTDINDLILNAKPIVVEQNCSESPLITESGNVESDATPSALADSAE